LNYWRERRNEGKGGREGWREGGEAGMVIPYPLNIF